MELEVQLKIMAGPVASFANKHGTENNIGNKPRAFPGNNTFHTLWEKVEFEIQGHIIRTEGNCVLRA